MKDHRGRPVVAVTGYGMISSLGQGVADSWGGLVAGRSGVKKITRFPTDHMRTIIAGAIIVFAVALIVTARGRMLRPAEQVAGQRAAAPAGADRAPEAA